MTQGPAQMKPSGVRGDASLLICKLLLSLRVSQAHCQSCLVEANPVTRQPQRNRASCIELEAKIVSAQGSFLGCPIVILLLEAILNIFLVGGL